MSDFVRRFVVLLSTLLLILPSPARTMLAALLLAGVLAWRGVDSPQVPALVALSTLIADVLLRFPFPHWLVTASFARLQTAAGIPVPVGLTLLFSCGSISLVFALFLLSRKLGAMYGALHLALSVVFLGIIDSVLVVSHAEESRVLLVILTYRMLLAGLVTGALLHSDRAGIASRPMRGCLATIMALLVVSLGDAPTTSNSIQPHDPPPIVFLWPEPQSDQSADYTDASLGFGYHAIGLFGEWPRVLERAGYLVIRATILDEPVLRKAEVVVIPSVTRAWKTGEEERLTEWIAAGGRLLVVGEHTNLNNCQDVLNPFLRPFGLGLNFDTTDGLLGDGLHGVITTRTSLGSLLSSNPQMPYNRGASIALSRGARPILIGQFWLADAGDQLAPDRAHLSDYHLSRGDRLGDVALMAMASAGRGHILLVGDSTPFLNQNTLYSSGFLLGTASLLTDRPARSTLLSVLIWFSAFAAGALSFRFVRSDRGLRWYALTVLVLATFGLSTRYQTGAPLSTTDDRLGVVSSSEQNAIDHDPFSPTSPTALGLSFSRHDLTPWLGDWTSLTKRPAVVAILNPSRTPRHRDWDRLLEWVHEGSIIILGGDADSPAFRDIATRTGVILTTRPVGSIGGETFTTFSAWEVSSCPAGATPIRAKEYVVGCNLVVGSGRFVLMADGGFFLSKNLETEESFDEKNIRFLDQILTSQPQALKSESLRPMQTIPWS